MMQSELQPIYPPFNFSYSPFDTNTSFDQEMVFCGVDDFDFSYSHVSPLESSVISSNSYIQTMFSDKFLDLENLDDEIQICSAMEVESIIPSSELEDIYEWINENENENSSSPLTIEGDEWSPCLSFDSTHNSPITDISLVLPDDDTKVDDQLILIHLLKAYGEAMMNGEKELAEVSVNSIKEKSSPLGNIVERLAYNLFQENQGEYLKQESIKNFAAAFNVLYQSLPIGRFAHFTANSTILESIPSDATTIQIVDFDIGGGIQWPPLIEALSTKQKAIKLTSIKSEDESTCWRFEDTKKRLLVHARERNANLQIEEKTIEELYSELNRMKKRGKNREWLIFNSMVALPHMGRRRSRKGVDEFLKISEQLVASFGGIVIFGNGEPMESLNNYASYFDSLLRHYTAVFEALERNFPAYLAEARTAMESLFLAPFMRSDDWLQDWEDTRNIYDERRLGGRKMSLESLAEAKQMVRESENYSVKVEGMRENEMVLLWKETPLVRVSTWM